MLLKHLILSLLYLALGLAAIPQRLIKNLHLLDLGIVIVLEHGENEEKSFVVTVISNTDSFPVRLTP